MNVHLCINILSNNILSICYKEDRISVKNKGCSRLMEHPYVHFAMTSYLILIIIAHQSMFCPTTFCPSKLCASKLCASTLCASTFCPTTFCPSTLCPSTLCQLTFSPLMLCPSILCPSTFCS